MTLEEIKKYYKSIFLLSDEHDTVIDAIVSIAINVHTESDSIWLMLLGAPSSGKTELAMTLSDLPKTFVISTMTENTFLSGMRGQDGKENSLLRQVGRKGLFIAKDYTTILSMDRTKRDTIISQFREIYDGHFVKRTGNGIGGTWEGKVNSIMCSTDALFSVDGEGAEMGRRALNYVLPEMTDKERMQMMKMSNKNLTDIKAKREKLKKMMATYVAEKVVELPKRAETDKEGNPIEIVNLPPVEELLEESIMELANFLTRARTATKRDFQGKLIQVMWPEAPTRANNQLQMLAQTFQWLNGGTTTEKHKQCIYKIALDSIPKLRRTALNVLASYDLVTTKGFAQHLGYPSKTAREWLEDLNVLGICTRSSGEAIHSPGADTWRIKDEHRAIVLAYDKSVEYKETQLEGDESIDDSGGGTYSYTEPDYNADPGVEIEHKEAAERAFDQMTGITTPEPPSELKEKF